MYHCFELVLTYSRSGKMTKQYKLAVKIYLSMYAGGIRSLFSAITKFTIVPYLRLPIHVPKGFSNPVSTDNWVTILVLNSVILWVVQT